MGCCDSSRASKASAGGQLEQPSEVNSSTTTGTDPVPTVDPSWFRDKLVARPSEWLNAQRSRGAAPIASIDQRYLIETPCSVIIRTRSYYVAPSSTDERDDEVMRREQERFIRRL